LVLNSREEEAISNQSFVRILVVDDFAAWRRFVIAKLRENRNMRVICVASDGLEAVLKAEELQPDLILLDIGLPKLDGIGAARRIREVAPGSKILFLSQELDLDVARAALNVGGNGYVVKSDAEDELFAAVEEVMRGKLFVSRRLADHTLTDPQAAGQLRREEPTASSAARILVRREVGRCHEAQFYSDGSLFLDGFTRFIGTALRARKAVIVIVTESHRASLLQRLQADGLDIRAAISEGRYVALDAVDTISKFMVNDMPDSGRFLRVVGDLISGPKAMHLRVAACGECASTLWGKGKADAAIRVEELTNEIARTYDIDILCGHSLDRLRCEEDSYTFRRICEEHSAVHSW
jgi:DNA-binding NarL/FixJ family response regulator